MENRCTGVARFFQATVASLLLLAGCGQRVDLDLGEMRREQESIIRTLEITHYEVLPERVKRENVMLEILVQEPDISLVTQRIVSVMDAHGYENRKVQTSANSDYLLFCNRKDSRRYAKWMMIGETKSRGLILRADGSEMVIRDCTQ